MGSPLWSWTTQCSCGKYIYKSRKDARKAARVFHADDSLSAYQCRHPQSPEGAWHIGHLPRAVEKGRSSRTDIRNKRNVVEVPCEGTGTACGNSGWKCNLESGHTGPHLAQNALGEWLSLE